MGALTQPSLESKAAKILSKICPAKIVSFTAYKYEAVKLTSCRKDVRMKDSRNIVDLIEAGVAASGPAGLGHRELLSIIQETSLKLWYSKGRH